MNDSPHKGSVWKPLWSSKSYLTISLSADWVCPVVTDKIESATTATTSMDFGGEMNLSATVLQRINFLISNFKRQQEWENLNIISVTAGLQCDEKDLVIMLNRENVVKYCSQGQEWTSNLKSKNLFISYWLKYTQKKIIDVCPKFYQQKQIN